MRNQLRPIFLKNSGASMSRIRTIQTSGLQRAGPGVDTDAGDRIEIEEIQDVRPRLHIDPEDRRLDRDPRDVAVDPHRAAMQTDARHQRAGRQQHDARAVPAEVGIELERARHEGRRGDAAAAVADHDDLVGSIGRAISTRRCAPASMQRSQQDGPPRAYSRR